jgi:asparaginyl-tRNA synthetase
MDLAGSLIKHVIGAVMDKAGDEIDFFNLFIDPGLKDRLENVYKTPFAHVTYTEAVEILQRDGDAAGFNYPVRWGIDLQTEHERYLTEKVFKGPVFVTDYPKEIKAFYMRLSDDGKTVAAMDLLVPGVGEIIGGSQREERLDILVNRMKECGLDEKDYNWYMDLRRFGGTPHAGFGLGFERMVMYLTGMTNIRDVIPFPRTPGYAEF